MQACWYAVYPLNLRHLEEMMGECGLPMDHSTVQRSALKLRVLLGKIFWQRKHSGGKCWRMDESYIKVMQPLEIHASRHRQ